MDVPREAQPLLAHSEAGDILVPRLHELAVADPHETARRADPAHQHAVDQAARLHLGRFLADHHRGHLDDAQAEDHPQRLAKRERDAGDDECEHQDAARADRPGGDEDQRAEDDRVRGEADRRRQRPPAARAKPGPDPHRSPTCERESGRELDRPDAGLPAPTRPWGGAATGPQAHEQAPPQRPAPQIDHALGAYTANPGCEVTRAASAG